MRRDPRETLEIFARQDRLGQESVEIESPIISVDRQDIVSRLFGQLLLFLGNVIIYTRQKPGWRRSRCGKSAGARRAHGLALERAARHCFLVVRLLRC